jgi:hypothetical protein
VANPVTPDSPGRLTREQIARIREVYPADRKPCAWCNSRKSHHFDCPVPDIHALLAALAAEGETPPCPETPYLEISRHELDDGAFLAHAYRQFQHRHPAPIGEGGNLILQWRRDAILKSAAAPSGETPPPAPLVEVVREWQEAMRLNADVWADGDEHPRFDHRAAAGANHRCKAAEAALLAYPLPAPVAGEGEAARPSEIPEIRRGDVIDYVTADGLCGEGYVVQVPRAWASGGDAHCQMTRLVRDGVVIWRRP